MLGDEGMELAPGKVKDFGVEWEGGSFQEFDPDRVYRRRVNEVVWSSTSSVSSVEKAEVSSRGLGERSDEVGTGGKQLFLVELSGEEEY